MVRIPVESTDVVSIGYEEDTRTMEVQFQTGAVYVYYEVPQDFFEQFLTAPSKGKFVNYVLKRSSYAYDRVA